MIVFLLSLFLRIPPFAPQCEVQGSYELHAASAIAAAYPDLDPHLLFAIATHESCLDNSVVTGKCSGVMQTMGPRPETLLDGYLRGADELRTWLRFSHGDMRVALAGYSGGVKIAQECAKGGSCSYADYFLGKARRLRRMFLQRTEEQAKI